MSPLDGEINDDDLIKYSQKYGEIEAQIDALQQNKKEFFKDIRSLHGKVSADGFKAAMRCRRMDAGRREEHLTCNRLAEQYVMFLEEHGQM